MTYRFASLTPADETAIALHLLSLDPEDRTLRFGAHASDATLLVYVGGLNFNRDVAEGAWDAGRLIGFAHLAVYPECGYAVGELGITVRHGYRALQVGSRLIERSIARAARYRLTRMYIHYMRRNLAMTRLVRRFGVEISYHGDEAQASLHLTPREQSPHTEVQRTGDDGRIEVFKKLPRGRAKGHVLLVHGAGGDGWQWRGELAALAETGYGAHALSLSGHGGSAPAEPSLARLSADVGEVLSELPDDTRLVGHSLGGYLVQQELTRSRRPAAVLLAPVPPDVPRGQDLAALLAGLDGERVREIAARVLAAAEPVAVESISTPVALISGDKDRVIPVPWMRATALRYRAHWTRLCAGHNLPVARDIGVPLRAGLLLES